MYIKRPFGRRGLRRRRRARPPGHWAAAGREEARSTKERHQGAVGTGFGVPRPHGGEMGTAHGYRQSPEGWPDGGEGKQQHPPGPGTSRGRRPGGASSRSRCHSCPSAGSTGRACATWPRRRTSTSPRCTTTSPRSATSSSRCSWSRAWSPSRTHNPMSPVRVAHRSGRACPNLLSDMMASMFEVQDFVRLMVGEAIRGESTARAVGLDLFTTFQDAIEEWVTANRPDLVQHGGAAEVARLLGAMVVGVFVSYAAGRARRGRCGRYHRPVPAPGPGGGPHPEPADLAGARPHARLPADGSGLGRLHRAGRRRLGLSPRLRQPVRVQPRRQRRHACARRRSRGRGRRPRPRGALCLPARRPAPARRRANPVELWLVEAEQPTLVAAGMSGGHGAYEEFVVHPLGGGCEADTDAVGHPSRGAPRRRDRCSCRGQPGTDRQGDAPDEGAARVPGLGDLPPSVPVPYAVCSERKGGATTCSALISSWSSWSSRCRS